MSEEIEAGNSLKNLKTKSDSYSELKKSIKTSISNLSANNLRDTIPGIVFNTQKVKANDFADKVKSLEKVSSVGSNARTRLMEMRFSQSEKKNLEEKDFNVLLERKDYAFEFNSSLTGKRTFCLDPQKLTVGLNFIELKPGLRKHNIKNDYQVFPPVSLHVADLQQILGVNIDGYFNVETFNKLNEKYFRSLLNDEEEFLTTTERLMSSLAQKLGNDSHFGGYLRGLVLSRSAILASKQGKSGEFERLFVQIKQYLPDNTYLKLKNKIHILSQIIKLVSTRENKIEKMGDFIKSSLDKASDSDKIKIFAEYNRQIFEKIPEKDLKSLSRLVKSLTLEHINLENRQIVIKTINNLVKVFQEKELKEEIPALQLVYNRFKAVVI